MLNLKPVNIKSMLYLLATAKVLHSTLTYMKDQPALQKTVIEKFLAFMEFSLSRNEENYEIFCNLFFYFLNISSLNAKQKLPVLNYFFVLDGYRIVSSTILNSKTPKTLQFKSRVVLAEVMNFFMKFLSKSPEPDESWRNKSYEIVFKGTSEGKEKVCDKCPTLEESQLYIFEKFIDFTWKKKTFDKFEVLSNMSLILAVTKERGEIIEPTFFNMLITLYTSTFKNIKVPGNNLLEVSSAVAVNSIKSVSAIDINFLTWWKAMAKPRQKLFNQVALKMLKQSKLHQTEKTDFKIFDEQSILQNFLENSNSSSILQDNLRTILCGLSDIGKSSSEFEKLLNKWQKLRAEKEIQKAENFLSVIAENVGSIEETGLKKKTAMTFLTFINSPLTTQQEKLAVIKATANLLRYERIPLKI